MMMTFKEFWYQLIRMFGLDHLCALVKAIIDGGNIMDVLR